MKVHKFLTQRGKKHVLNWKQIYESTNDDFVREITIDRAIGYILEVKIADALPIVAIYFRIGKVWHSFTENLETTEIWYSRTSSKKPDVWRMVIGFKPLPSDKEMSKQIGDGRTVEKSERLGSDSVDGVKQDGVC